MKLLRDPVTIVIVLLQTMTVQKVVPTVLEHT